MLQSFFFFFAAARRRCCVWMWRGKLHFHIISCWTLSGGGKSGKKGEVAYRKKFAISFESCILCIFCYPSSSSLSLSLVVNNVNLSIPFLSYCCEMKNFETHLLAHTNSHLRAAELMWKFSLAAAQQRRERKLKLKINDEWKSFIITESRWYGEIIKKSKKRVEIDWIAQDNEVVDVFRVFAMCFSRLLWLILIMWDNNRKD